MTCLSGTINSTCTQSLARTVNFRGRFTSYGQTIGTPHRMNSHILMFSQVKAARQKKIDDQTIYLYRENIFLIHHWIFQFEQNCFLVFKCFNRRTLSTNSQEYASMTTSLHQTSIQLDPLVVTNLSLSN